MILSKKDEKRIRNILLYMLNRNTKHIPTTYFYFNNLIDTKIFCNIINYTWRGREDVMKSIINVYRNGNSSIIGVSKFLNFEGEYEQRPDNDIKRTVVTLDKELINFSSLLDKEFGRIRSD